MASTADEQKPNFKLPTSDGHPEANLALIPTLTQTDPVHNDKNLLKKQKAFAGKKALVYINR